MKETRLRKLFAVGSICAIALGTAFAQQSTTTTTTTENPDGSVTRTTRTTTLTGSGMISTYTPGSDYITFRSEANTEPVRYYYTKTTSLVDPEGRTVEWSDLRPEMPVTYSYVREGDRMVVTKVTLQKPVSYYKKTTTTTTTTTNVRP